MSWLRRINSDVGNYSIFMAMLLSLVVFDASARGTAHTAEEFYSPSELVEFTSGTVAGDNLKDYLKNSLERNHISLSYNQARQYMFGELYLEEDEQGYFVRDVYCGKIFRQDVGVGVMRIPDQDLINCEHTWPQSRFTRRHNTSTQKTDLHHLFPTDNHANSLRGNNPFADVADHLATFDCESSQFGQLASGQNSGKYFEPPAEHRGNVARALFYFSVKYDMEISSIEEMFLKKWHHDDPVDAAEFHRNNRIMEIQGNRNPFIDYPELAERISNF